LKSETSRWWFRTGDLRIIRAMQQRLGLPDDKVMVNIDATATPLRARFRWGCATPSSKQIEKGDLVLLMAVGAGYTTGACCCAGVLTTSLDNQA